MAAVAGCAVGGVPQQDVHARAAASPQCAALPASGEYFEIRLESIGGLGAHAAGQVLATAAVVRLGLNGAHFSSYGSEKKGSVVRSFVRLASAGRPIRTSAPVESPDVLVVFHAALLRNPVTLAGLKGGGTLIYNAPAKLVPDALAAVPRSARVMRVDATRIALELRSRPNAVLLGALCAAYPLFDATVVLRTLSEAFAGKHAEAVASNERAFHAGAHELEQLTGVGRAEGDLPVARGEPLWGYDTQPAGGILPEPGNTVWNDLSASRTGWMPVLHSDKCIHCGVCDLVCPDFCLAWGGAGDRYERTLAGIDYRYCKGCLRCVESCPTGALTKEAESAGMAERLRVPLFPQLIG
jgi:pyruvate ferredoxin oxidoreductase gamma subunit